MNYLRWWENPERVCADNWDYADLTRVQKDPLDMPSRRSRRDKIEAMRVSCLSCPVYAECLADSLRFPDEQFYGIRAGRVGMS